MGPVNYWCGALCGCPERKLSRDVAVKQPWRRPYKQSVSFGPMFRAWCCISSLDENTAETKFSHNVWVGICRRMAAWQSSSSWMMTRWGLSGSLISWSTMASSLHLWQGLWGLWWGLPLLCSLPWWIHWQAIHWQAKVLLWVCIYIYMGLGVFGRLLYIWVWGCFGRLSLIPRDWWAWLLNAKLDLQTFFLGGGTGAPHPSTIRTTHPLLAGEGVSLDDKKKMSTTLNDLNKTTAAASKLLLAADAALPGFSEADADLLQANVCRLRQAAEKAEEIRVWNWAYMWKMGRFMFPFFGRWHSPTLARICLNTCAFFEIKLMWMDLGFFFLLICS